MNNYYHLLTDEQRAIQQMVRQFADEKIIPTCKECDVTGRFPRELYDEAVEMGLTMFTVPEKYGGSGGDIFTYALIKEELARGDAGFSGTVAGAYMGVVPIKVAGNDYHWGLVSEILRAGGIMSFTLTEANAGSDSAALKTTYVVDGEDVIINGRKSFISSGEVSNLYTLFATSDPALRAKGISCFLVPRDTPGISIGKHEDKMGYRTSCTNDVIFEDVRVPLKNMIGGHGEGMDIVKRSLGYTRPTSGAGAVGNAQYAYECAVEYSKVRQTFGKPIYKNQGVAFMLADMYTKLEASRQMVWHACKCADAGVVDTRLFSASKVFASDMCMQVCTDAVQILGGNGYSREYPVEKRFRDAKIYQIFEGTNQIQRKIISGEIIYN